MVQETIQRRISLTRAWLFRRKIILGSIVAAILVSGFVFLLFLFTFQPYQSHAATPGNIVDDDDDFNAAEPRVKTIRPKLNPQFVRSIKEPAYVEGFYQSELFSRVAGTVKYIEKNIGDPVAQGEVLVEIDVPDLVQEIAQKQSLIKQAEADLEAAKADILTKQEAVQTALTVVSEKEAALDRDKSQAERLHALYMREAVTKERWDEAEAAYRTTMAAVQRARSDVKVAQAKVAEARADVDVKKARVVVTQEDRKRAQTMADLAKIHADFNGVVVYRGVDPGAFVQNAAGGGNGRPLLSIESIAKVTIAMMVPERSAAYVGPDTDAVIQIDALAGEQIRTKVTRFSPSLDPRKGRTMRVEVDLYNPPERNYRRSMIKGVSSFLAPLGAREPANAAALTVGGRSVWGRRGLLMPGMYGHMRLFLQKFGNAFLVPTGAVFSEEGETYIYQVVDEHVKRVPVRVQLEDGIQAKIAIIVRPASMETGDEEVLRDLDGSEDIILSGHGEIQPEQKVKLARVGW